MKGTVVKAYSKAYDGNTSLSKNFKVREFACKDGSDQIFISPTLVQVLQEIRDHFNSPIVITSGFRTHKHNFLSGGSRYSQHMYGTAADIKVSGVEPRRVADYAEKLLQGTGGVGRYETFTHVDVRTVMHRWKG